MKNFVFIISVFLFISSCQEIGMYEKTAVIPAQAWAYDYKPSFNFIITDTTSRYNIYIILRHTDAYEYNNIWVNFGTQAPSDKMQFQNIDLSLGSDAKGWDGNGMDDIFEVRKNVTHGPVSFKKPGKYTFTLSQIMRENPLKNILNAGIRIEKVRS